jgi:hypothetical protein
VPWIRGPGIYGFCETITGLSQAVPAFRPRAFADYGGVVPWRRFNLRCSAFIGFFVFDIPYKSRRRLPWGRTHFDVVRRKWSTLYGGLVFNRATVEAIGLPREDFLLDGDDREYICQINRAGGRIPFGHRRLRGGFECIVCRGAEGVTDFESLATKGADPRIYYGFRNEAHWADYCVQSS